MTWPTSAASNAELLAAGNNLSTELDGALDDDDTSITVVSTSGFPSAGVVSIEDEIVHYTGTTATSFTGCTRGYDSTTAVAHSSGVAVDGHHVAAHHNLLRAEIQSIETSLTTDVTHCDVSTSKHGLVPKAPNDTTKFLRGDATWSLPKPNGPYNVKDDFGAKGDNSTDDTTAIQNAITYAQATGAILHIPKGTYLVSDSLLITGGMKIMGGGPGQSVIKQTAASKITINISTGAEVVLEDFFITASGSGLNSGTGIKIVSANRSALRGVTVDSHSYGLHLYEVDNVRVLQSTFRCADRSLFAEWPSNPDHGDLELEGNQFETATYGVYLSNISGIRLISNKFMNTGTDLHFTCTGGCSDLMVVGNSFEGQVGVTRHIYLETSGGGQLAMVNIVGNQSADDANLIDHLYVPSGSKIIEGVIVGNTFFYGSRAIALKGTACNQWVIGPNTIYYTVTPHDIDDWTYKTMVASQGATLRPRGRIVSASAWPTTSDIFDGEGPVFWVYQGVGVRMYMRSGTSMYYVTMSAA